MVGCSCQVCTSDNPKNSRYRSSLLIQGPSGNLLIDAPPELRLSLVREKVTRIDAVLLTHAHADHVMGLDDLRRFSELSGKSIPILAQPSVLSDVRRIFEYAFVPNEHIGGGLPRFEMVEAEAENEICGLRVMTFPVMHGKLEVKGVRIGDLAYLTDVSEIPDFSREWLTGLKTLFLDATRYMPHPSHLHYEASLELAATLGAEVTFLTHLSHDYDYEVVMRELPKGVKLSYDGLRVQVGNGEIS